MKITVSLDYVGFHSAWQITWHVDKSLVGGMHTDSGLGTELVLLKIWT